VVAVPSAPVHRKIDGFDFQRPFTAAQLLEIGAQWIEGFIRKVLEALTGGFIPGLGTAFDQLRDWGEALADQIVDLPIIRQFFQFITGLSDPDIADITHWASGLVRGLVRGVIPQWMLPTIHIGRLTNTLPPLVADGGFDQIPDGEPGGPGEWFRDPVKGHTKPGAAGIEADGAYHDLMTQPVAVAAGQKYRVGAWVACELAAGTTGCVQLQVLEFGDGDDAINTHVVASWTPNDTIDFTEIFDTYTVPEGVKMAAVTPCVTEGFTAGKVFFDDVTGPSTGQIMPSWVKNLAALFGVSDVDLDGDIDVADIWNSLWLNVWKALNWIPTVAQDVIDRIINAIDNLGDLVDTGLSPGAILLSLSGVVHSLLGNQARTSQLDARVLALETAANSIVLTFNGAASNTIGGSYTSTFSGAGAGTLAGRMGLDGRGNLMWKPLGALAGSQISRYNTALDTDKCVIKVILASSPQTYLFDAAYTYICWRMNTARTIYTRLRIGFGEIRLQVVNSGTATTIGTPWIGNPRGGQEIEIESGDPTEPRKYVVKLAGTEIINAEDTGDVGQVGSSYRGVGFGMTTGNRLVLFQNIPAGLSVATFAEVA
jgi:hypothetical protein